MDSQRIVLYAEDDENDAFFMKRAFGKLKRSDALRVVRDGSEAVRYLRGEDKYSNRTLYPPVCALLLDMKMPGMSGLEVLTWVRTQSEFASLPVIMFTSSTQESDVELSRARGADAYLVKPSNSDHLAVLVSKILEAAMKGRRLGEPLALDGNQIS